MVCWFVCLFVHLRGGREGEREGKKHQCVRDTLIDCLFECTPTGTGPETQACALTRNQTGNLSLCRMTPNRLSHIRQGWSPCSFPLYLTASKSQIPSYILAIDFTVPTFHAALSKSNGPHSWFMISYFFLALISLWYNWFWEVNWPTGWQQKIRETRA